MKLTQRINQKQLIYRLLLGLAVASPLLIAPAAWAHHPFDGQTPNNLITGFLSGLGHPVVGLDHLTFVVASGLVAIGLQWGVIIPMAFLGGTLLGTSFHLMAMEMPLLEVAIASSVILFGLMLVARNREESWFPVFQKTAVVAALGAIAGIFHGYAYGEAIIGAEMTPLVAYLAGFTLIQGGIAFFAYGLGERLFSTLPSLMRYCGLAICAIGFVFVSQAI